MMIKTGTDAEAEALQRGKALTVTDYYLSSPFDGIYPRSIPPVTLEVHAATEKKPVR
jgi:hypothetical protein